jgi:hypothetical protein
LTKAIATLVIVMASIVYLPLSAASNLISAQNTTITTMSGSLSLTKMHLEEAKKALEVGNKEATSIHLNAAHQAISSLSFQAKEQFEAGMKAFSAGDSNGAHMHLKALQK